MDKFFKWTVLFIVLVILAAGGVAFYTVFLADGGMTMPSYREMSLIDAVTDAEQLGLTVRVEQIDSKLPTGRVLAQWPEPGAKIRGSERNVILNVSRGGERRPIPDIRGVSLRDATNTLEENGFTVGDVIRIKDSSNSGLPAGSVIAQSPASPASVPVSTNVDLLVSEGSEDGRVAVPNVSNMSESAARGVIESAGLRVVSVEKEKTRNRNVLEGQVASTRPAAGTMVKKGDGVRFFISIGDNPETTAPAIPGRSASTTEPDLMDTDISVLDQDAARRRQQNSGAVIPETVPQRQTPASQNDPHSPEFNLPQTSVAAATTPPPVVPSAPAPVASPGNKIARVRYQVPPILRPLPLKIEIVDTQGTRVLLERNARANETVQVDGAYSQEAVVSIWLGGEFVWQERFR